MKNSPTETVGLWMRLFLLSWYLYKATPSFTPPTSSLRDSVLREKPVSCSLTESSGGGNGSSEVLGAHLFQPDPLGESAGQWAKSPGFLHKKGKLGSTCKDNYSCFTFRVELSLFSLQTIQIRAVCIIFDLLPVKCWRPLMSILCASSSAPAVPMALTWPWYTSRHHINGEPMSFPWELAAWEFGFI